MKSIAYLCLVVALMTATSTTAQTKKKSTPKTATTSTTTVDVAPPTRVVSDSEYSYAKGVTHTEGLGYFLESQYHIADEQYPQVVHGLDVYYSATASERLRLLALAAGIEGGAVGATEMFPRFNELITGHKDSAYIDVKTFVRGYIEQAKDSARYTSEQARQIVARQDQYLRLQKAKASYDEHLAYVAANSAYKPLTDGIYYRVLTKGKGALPKADSRVKVNYEGRLLDGKVFDSSYQRGEPIVFGLNQVIKGWGLALQKMPVGSTWEVVIPQELAYGERGAGADIPPYSSLVFKIELISIEK